MVTLLRRYLYIAHRCGIEPVLAYDELDKLEDHLDGNRNGVQMVDKQQISPRLHAFLDALLHLRDSSGAVFLTILVTGSKLHYKLRKDRLSSLQLGVGMIQTGTLIQQECCVGPISYNAAKRYFKEKNNGVLDMDYCAYFWLQAHGMCGNYMGLLEQHTSGNKSHVQKQQLTHAENLAGKLEIAWKLDDAWRYLQFREGQEDALNP